MLTALFSLLGVGSVVTVAGLALHLFGWSGIVGKLRAVSPHVWYALAIVAAVVGSYLLVEHKIHQAYAAGSKNGHAEQFAHDQAAMDKIRAQARDYKRKLDAANSTIHTQEKARHDQVVTANHALADALRLRVQQSVRAQAGARGGASLPGATPASGVASGPLAQADAAVAAGADAGTVCVPAGPLIDYAETADNDHDALEKTEDAWTRYKEKWPSSTAAPPPQ